jgi:hypothetical protein
MCSKKDSDLAEMGYIGRIGGNLEVIMDWVRKNIAILSFLLLFARAMTATTAYIIGSIHGVETRLGAKMNARFNDIDTRLVRIETVLVMKGLMPPHLATAEKGE